MGNQPFFPISKKLVQLVKGIESRSLVVRPSHIWSRPKTFCSCSKLFLVDKVLVSELDWFPSDVDEFPPQLMTKVQNSFHSLISPASCIVFSILLFIICFPWLDITNLKLLSMCFVFSLISNSNSMFQSLPQRRG